jgi:hypothetical protein
MSQVTAWTPNILREFVLKLKVKNAMPFEDGCFKLITHPDLINQMRSSSAFIDMYKYTQTGVFEEGTMAKGGERGLVGVLGQVLSPLKHLIVITNLLLLLMVLVVSTSPSCSVRTLTVSRILTVVFIPTSRLLARIQRAIP